MSDRIEDAINDQIEAYEEAIGADLDEDTAQALGELIDAHHAATGNVDVAEALEAANESEYDDSDWDDSEVYDDSGELELVMEPDDEAEFEAAEQLIEGRLGRPLSEVEREALWSSTPEGTDRQGYQEAAMDIPTARDIATDPQARQTLAADVVAETEEEETEAAYERGEAPEEQWSPPEDSNVSKLVSAMEDVAEEQGDE